MGPSWDAYVVTDIAYEWRGALMNDEVNALHAEAFEHRLLEDDWVAQVASHSLGWVCARDADGLVGFVNVPWDGGVHAFILDAMVARRAARRGIGTELVSIATTEAAAAGCEWLHVDFEDELRPFYFEACGFEPTNAGLIALRECRPILRAERLCRRVPSRSRRLARRGGDRSPAGVFYRRRCPVAR
jgi:GNAT superfamily N-acetyltransferase